MLIQKLIKILPKEAKEAVGAADKTAGVAEQEVQAVRADLAATAGPEAEGQEIGMPVVLAMEEMADMAAMEEMAARAVAVVMAETEEMEQMVVGAVTAMAAASLSLAGAWKLPECLR